LDWCEPCIEKRVAQLKQTAPDLEIWVDGGFGSDSNDGRSICNGCGAILDYNLTDFGVRQELEHYMFYLPTQISVSDAFQIMRLIEGARMSADDALGRKAVKIGRKAIAQVAKQNGESPIIMWKIIQDMMAPDDEEEEE
jgi:hypothetical protein